MVLNNVNCNSCKVYNLTWSEYGSSLITTAQHLRNKEDLTDVTISAGGKIFPAHKLVLSAASPLLMELLKNTKCQHPILMLAGISAADLETILDFIYQGKININSEKLPSFLQAAQFLDIQALSPTALILNTSQEPALLSTAVNQENSNNDTKVSLSKTVSVTTNNTLTKESESEFTSQKRKRRVKSAEVNSLKKTDFSSTCKKSFFLSHGEDAIISTHPNTAQEISKQKTVSKSPGTENENQKALSVIDEKKIISDLPVNCKLCGVTIRQSRNLRRHIDQKHSKLNHQQKQKNPKDRTILNQKTNISSKIASVKKNELNNTNPSAFLNFSDDSFTQLTEEILNYSITTELTPNENSFSSSLAVSTTPVENCLMEDMVPTSAHDSSSSSSTFSNSNSTSAPIAQARSLSTLLESDLCFPLPTITRSTVTAESTKSMSNDSGTSMETFECSNLESCNVNDIALKELENQLFSVCFCSAENDV